MNNAPHIPVLKEEFLDFFKDRKLKVFVDGTLGAGGHSLALLEAHPEIEMLLGFDQDQDALKYAKERLKPFEDKVVYVPNNFCHLQEELHKRGIKEVDGIFLDIGVSSMQIDQAQRGFSFSKEGPLDMRMDRECTLTAQEIVNTWSEKELTRIFEEYGDLPKARKLAKAILFARQKKEITTTTQLTEVLKDSLTNFKRSLPPMTLVFQALRIAVNNELTVLESALPQAIGCLRPGGRLGVVSFHSGEDKIVKNLFKEWSKKPAEIHLLTKKPVVASFKEIKKNSRCKSAKLRFCEKIEENKL